jgi:hypothetical protein
MIWPKGLQVLELALVFPKETENLGLYHHFNFSLGKKHLKLWGAIP